MSAFQSHLPDKIKNKELACSYSTVLFWYINNHNLLLPVSIIPSLYLPRNKSCNVFCQEYKWGVPNTCIVCKNKVEYITFSYRDRVLSIQPMKDLSRRRNLSGKYQLKIYYKYTRKKRSVLIFVRGKGLLTAQHITELCASFSPEN